METTTLPNGQEILVRLARTANDELTGKIYAHIAQFENRELTAGGIVLVLAEAIHDYVRGGELAAHLHGLVPNWIDQLVDNQIVAKEAKELHEKVMAERAKAAQEEISLEPPITTPRQASAYLRCWILAQGFGGRITVLQSHGRRSDRSGTYFDFDVLSPHGVFHVHENGRVEDCYHIFAKKD